LKYFVDKPDAHRALGRYRSKLHPPIRNGEHHATPNTKLPAACLWEIVGTMK